MKDEDNIHLTNFGLAMTSRSELIVWMRLVATFSVVEVALARVRGFGPLQSVAFDEGFVQKLE